MCYIWITIRCYFVSLSIYVFLFFTRYSTSSIRAVKAVAKQLYGVIQETDF